MIIETKYNDGDKVWFLCDNEVTEEAISGIFIQVANGQPPNILYDLNHGHIEDIPERKLFSSKKELLNSL